MRIAILTRQVTNYHHVRFAAAGQRFASCDVISMANQGKFAQVLSRERESGYVAHRLYAGTDAYRKAAADGELQKEVARTLDAIAPDVVAIPGWASPESFAGLKWVKRRRARAILMSDSQAHDAARNSLREGIKARIIRLFDAALVAGSPHRRYVVQLGMPPDRVFLGYDVVDNKHFVAGADSARAHQHRERLGLPERYIFASARFIPKKNLVRLIRGYAEAISQLADAPALFIAGDGEGRGELEALVKSLSLQGRVHLPGFFSFDDIPALYGLAEAFAHVPTSEQWGLVVNEAAASGLPMLLSRGCGAASELLEEGVGGWLVQAEDVDAIAEVLRRLMVLAPEQRMRMGAANRARVLASWGPDDFARSLRFAAEAAQAHPIVSLNPLDRALIYTIGRRPIEAVQ